MESMENTTREYRKKLALSAYLLFSLFIVSVGCQFLLERRRAILKSSQVAIGKAMAEEKMQFIKHFSFQFDPDLSPYNISGEEVKGWYDQWFLFTTDSSRHRLDSLFRIKLKEEGISALTAIQYIAGKDTATSCQNDLLKKMIALDTVSYRKDNEDSTKIKLCPYIQLPHRSLLNHWHIYLLLCIWGIMTGGFLWMLKRDRCIGNEIMAVKDSVADMSVEPHIPEIKTQWEILPCGFRWDALHGVLKQGDSQVILSAANLDYFRSFIKKENYILTYKEILSSVYNLDRDSLDNNARSRITHGIDRLKKSLEAFEDIKIELIRGFGYRMVFTSSQKRAEEEID